MSTIHKTETPMSITLPCSHRADRRISIFDVGAGEWRFQQVRMDAQRCLSVRLRGTLVSVKPVTKLPEPDG
jgi:hypothetical protein